MHVSYDEVQTKNGSLYETLYPVKRIIREMPGLEKSFVLTEQGEKVLSEKSLDNELAIYRGSFQKFCEEHGLSLDVHYYIKTIKAPS